MLKWIAMTGLMFAVLLPSTVHAQKIRNGVAVFAALDKVTANISPLEIPVDRSEKFGALTITPRVCNTRPLTEQPVTSAFVEIDETQLDGSDKRIFTGWMFAESPGLHGVEHPVFDVWLTSCKTNSAPAASGSAEKAPPVAPPAAAPAAAPPAPPPAPEPPQEAAAPEPLPWAKPPPNAASRNR
jgi:hypothetical protein